MGDKLRRCNPDLFTSWRTCRTVCGWGVCFFEHVSIFFMGDGWSAQQKVCPTSAAGQQYPTGSASCEAIPSTKLAAELRCSTRCCRPSLFDGSWMAGVFSHQQLQRPREAFSDLNILRFDNLMSFEKMKQRNVNRDFQKQGLAANWLQSEERSRGDLGSTGNHFAFRTRGVYSCLQPVKPWEGFHPTCNNQKVKKMHALFKLDIIHILIHTFTRNLVMYCTMLAVLAEAQSPFAAAAGKSFWHCLCPTVDDLNGVNS